MPRLGPGKLDGNTYTGFPVTGTVTQRFSQLPTPTNPRGHNGLDIAGVRGDPIYAPDDGQVWWANIEPTDDGRNGNFIILEHFEDDGVDTAYLTQYMHLDRPTHLQRPSLWNPVEDNHPGDGQLVRRGDIIGYMGNTGAVYTGGRPINDAERRAGIGTHLHWMVTPYRETVGWPPRMPMDPLAAVTWWEWSRDTVDELITSFTIDDYIYRLTRKRMSP